jgi:hypothetical protein
MLVIRYRNTKYELRITNYERHEVPIPARQRRARTRGANSERDSSGTTEATDQREGAKVMERIARRERE